MRWLIIPPYVVYGGILSLLFTFCMYEYMYGYGFLNQGFTDQREILCGGLAWSRTGLLFWGDSPWDCRILGRRQGATWPDMLLAKALVFLAVISFLLQVLFHLKEQHSIYFTT